MELKILVITPLVLKQLASGQSVEISTIGLKLVPNDQIKNSTVQQPELQIGTGPICLTCGMLMMPNGSCYKCQNCGSTSGCS